MKRKTSKLPSRVWTYGCLHPTKEAESIFKQLRLANIYYNKLIEIERERRTKYREARSEIGAVLRTLEGHRDAITKLVEEHRDSIKKTRSAQRKHVEASTDMRAVIKVQLERRRAVVDQIRTERDRLKTDPRLVIESERINTSAQERVKEERAKCGIYWGTYLLIERAVEQARKAKDDPKFHRFDGTGRIGVQVQGGMDKAEIFGGGDTRVQFSPLPDGQWDTRSGRRHAYTTIKLRVGSDGRKPIWAEVPAVLHRPLPADARVMWAWLKVHRIGPRTKFEFQITMESEEFRRDPPLVGSERVAALDIGWRKLASGDVRVGYLYDYMGKRRELVLTKEVREGLAFCDSLRAINDGHFNTARAVLKAWVAEHPKLLPEWLPAEIETMHAWHSRGRLSRLARRWSDEATGVTAEERKVMPPDLSSGYVAKAWRDWKSLRLGRKLDLFAESKEIFEFVGGDPVKQIVCYLEFWRRKEMHLWSWEANQRERSHLRRKDIYRNWAAELRREYAYVVIEDFDLRQFARERPPESEEKSLAIMRRMRADAAPNELRLALESVFGKVCLPRVNDKDTTRAHDCGHINTGALFKLDRAASIVVTCEKCGVEFDQDEQAAKNIFSVYAKERSGGDPTPPVSKKRSEGDPALAAPSPAE